MTPRHVAIDLTPVLPGGENGGAKVFALELVAQLAQLAPQARFTLLTQAASHEELAALDSANVSRMQVLGPATSRMRGAAYNAGSALLSRMPQSLRRVAARGAYAVHARMKSGRGALLRELGADLLFCPFTAPSFRERGVPVICTLYDLQFRTHPEFFTPEEATLRERAFTDACRWGDRLAAISDFTRAQAIDFCGIDPERAQTIHLRLSRRMLASRDDAVLARLGLERNGYLVYPANFWPHKNHERLLAAFARARREPGMELMKLVLTGAPGAREQSIKAHVEAEGLRDAIVFAGFVDESALATLIADSRALVFPSLYEGFGLPVLEAMALGTPVACADAAALPEVSGDAALRFDATSIEAIADAMVRIARDEALRTRLIEAGHRRAASFADPDRMAREYWSLFEQVMPVPA